MSEIPKNDLMFLQNEILGDIKKVENKLDNKIYNISESLNEQKTTYQKKMNHLEAQFNILKQKTQELKSTNSNEREINTKINSLEKKLEDYILKLDSRITLFQSNFHDSCYKYDKAIMNNTTIPGLIGERCPYSSMRDFYESVHRKINDSLRQKEQQSLDLKKYKEKMESVITQSKTRLPMFENRITSYFDTQIKELDNKNKERIDIVEERINNMRIENGKYSNGLVEKCNELENRWLTIDDTIKKALDQYNEEILFYKNSFKEMNNRIKNFEDKYNIFQENFKKINSLNEAIKQIKNNQNIFDNKINEINEVNNKLILKIRDIENYEENKNKSINNKTDNNEKSRNIRIDNYNISKTNYLEYKIQNEEMEINSVINSKQNNNMDDNALNKMNIKENNIKVGLRKGNNKKNYCDLLKKYQKKKENFFDDSYEYTKINNIIFDADFFKRSNYLGNSSINDYYSQNYRIKRAKKIFNRVKSGIATHRFPFTTNENNNYDDQTNNINIKNDYYNNYHKRNSLPEDFDMNDNSIKNEILNEEYENKKDSTITGNIHRSQKAIKQKSYDFNENFPPGHKFVYLDRKIDILSNVMVDTINKIIFQINYLKKNSSNNNNNHTNRDNKNNEIISPKKKNLNNSLSDTKLLSPSCKDNNYMKKINLDKKRKLSQKFQIISKEQDNKKILNKN